MPTAQANELIGGIVEQTKTVRVNAEDLVNGQFPLPITMADKLVDEGRETAILAVATLRDGGVTVGYDLKIKG